MEIIGVNVGVLKINDNGQPYLLASHCGECNEYTFPQKKVCPSCMNYNLITITEVGKIGKIDSFTKCHVAPKGFEAPYYLGIVEVENKLKVTTIIDNNNEEHLENGAEVELTVAPTSKTEDGQDIFGWKYKVKAGVHHA